MLFPDQVPTHQFKLRTIGWVIGAIVTAALLFASDGWANPSHGYAEAANGLSDHGISRCYIHTYIQQPTPIQPSPDVPYPENLLVPVDATYGVGVGFGPATNCAPRGGAEIVSTVELNGRPPQTHRTPRHRGRVFHDNEAHTLAAPVESLHLRAFIRLALRRGERWRNVQGPCSTKGRVLACNMSQSTQGLTP